METLVDIAPKDILLHHGPSKLLVDHYHWHQPKVGIVASYQVKDKDVIDHFGIFRGVDQIESFAQAATCSCSVFLHCEKYNTTPQAIKDDFIITFISVGEVNFHNYLENGDTFICLGYITFYKFRQMVCSGRIYKVPSNLDLDDYFKNFDENRLRSYDLSSDFVLICELNNITGRALKKDLLKNR
jgi:hypothetical protein